MYGKSLHDVFHGEDLFIDSSQERQHIVQNRCVEIRVEIHQVIAGYRQMRSLRAMSYYLIIIPKVSQAFVTECVKVKEDRVKSGYVCWGYVNA